MKKWFKTLTSAVLSTAMACSAFAFIGCGDDNGSDGSGNNDNMFRDDDFADDTNRLPARYIPRNIKFAKDATFADGTTEQMVDFDVTPEFDVEIPSGQKLVGWQNVNNPSEIFPAEFKMPARDITIKPIINAAVEGVPVQLKAGTFSDGSTYKGFPAGTKLKIGKDVKFDNAEDLKSFVGWKVGDEYIWGEEEIEVPNSTMCFVTPFTAGNAVAKTDGSINGRIKYGVKQGEGSHWRFANTDKNAFPVGVQNVGNTTAPSFTDCGSMVGQGEARKYHFTGGSYKSEAISGTNYITEATQDNNKNIAAGWYVMEQTMFKIQKNKTYVAKFCIENKGSEDLTIHGYVSGSGTTPKPGEGSDPKKAWSNSKDVTIKAGETSYVYVTFNFSGDNNNMMPVLELKNAVKEFNVEVSSYLFRAFEVM